jgi:glycosyltransferase involved in cell wall biosynthesis
MLARVIKEYEGALPIIQHFHDYIPNDSGVWDSRELVEDSLWDIRDALTDVWALTPMIATEVSRITGRKVSVVNTFCGEIPRRCKTQHRSFGPDFRIVIVGNFWIPRLFRDICAAWRWVGETVGGVQPIEWMCHSRSVDLVVNENVSLEPEIKPVGFFTGAQLLERLMEADMSIIPFNREKWPGNDYARYSLPSRITETAAAGVPMFAAAGSRTGTACYLREESIGVSATPSNESKFRQSLLAFARDRQLRSACGTRARALAEREFDLERYQRFLYGRLRGLRGMARGG